MINIQFLGFRNPLSFFLGHPQSLVSKKKVIKRQPLSYSLIIHLFWHSKKLSLQFLIIILPILLKYPLWGFGETYILWFMILDLHLISMILCVCFSDVQQMAIDWLTRNLYFVDHVSDRIFVCDYNGSVCVTLIDLELQNPKAIAVDPIAG